MFKLGELVHAFTRKEPFNPCGIKLNTFTHILLNTYFNNLGSI